VDRAEVSPRSVVVGPGEVGWWEWRGRLIARAPGRPSVHLADLAGTDAVRELTVGGEAWLVMRRALLVLDPSTGEPAESIEVPWSDRRVEVAHHWLDPVAEQIAELVADLGVELTAPGPADGAPADRAPADRAPADGAPIGDVVAAGPAAEPDTARQRVVGPLPVTGSSGERWVARLARERVWSEPFPLSPRQWPGAAPGPLLEIAETCDVLASMPPDVPWAAGSLTRIEPWWPTFALGAAPGHLVVHLHGTRRHRWADVGGGLRRSIEGLRPEFAFAPAALPSPADSVDHLWASLAVVRRATTPLRALGGTEPPGATSPLRATSLRLWRSRSRRGWPPRSR
jgi:hypothetical protein